MRGPFGLSHRRIGPPAWVSHRSGKMEYILSGYSSQPQESKLFDFSSRPASLHEAGAALIPGGSKEIEVNSVFLRFYDCICLLKRKQRDQDR